MRKIFSVVSVIVAATFAPNLYAAAPPTTKPTAVSKPADTSKLAAFLSVKGTMLVKERGPQISLEQHDKSGGTTLDYELEATPIVVSTPGSEAQRAKGIQITISGYRIQTVSLDMEEAQSLSKALMYFIQLIPKWKGDSSKEALFLTSDSFEIRMAGTKTGEVFASASAGRLETAYYPLHSEDDINKLKQAIDSGITWLQQH